VTYVTNYNLVSTAKPVLFFFAVAEQIPVIYQSNNYIHPDNISIAANANPFNSSDGSVIGISDLGSDKYHLRSPIFITLRQAADDEYVVSFGEAEISRSGETAKEALDWLKSSLVELYELFKKQRSHLGLLPQKQLRTLEKYLVAKSDSKTSSY